MAASGKTDELSALEEARARLEAQLAGDENWRALKRFGMREDDAQADARNTRLKLALAENPLYQAWNHLGEALLALQASGEGTDGGAEALGGNAEGSGSVAGGPMARRLAVSRMQNPLEADGEVKSRPGDAPASRPPPPRKQGRDARPSLRPHGMAGTEPDEATVTFVRREPLLPAAQLPADLGSLRASELFERLRGVSDGVEQAPASPRVEAEEAEVVIFTEEGARAQREAVARAGTVRRLRKALSGD